MKTSCARTSRRAERNATKRVRVSFPSYSILRRLVSAEKKKKKRRSSVVIREIISVSAVGKKKKKDEQKRKKLLIIINVYIPSDPEKSCPDLRLFSVSMRAGEIKILIFTRSTPSRGRTARPVKRFSPTDMHTRIQRRGRRRLTVDNTYLENPLHGA